MYKSLTSTSYPFCLKKLIAELTKKPSKELSKRGSPTTNKTFLALLSVNPVEIAVTRRDSGTIVADVIASMLLFSVVGFGIDAEETASAA